MGPAVKVAVSTIAWAAVDDQRVAALIHASNGHGVEVAPTREWERPLEASEDEVADYRQLWEREHLSIAALQALFYGRPDLQLFRDDDTLARTLAYLCGIIRLGAMLGAGSLVFGSPKNRLTHGRDADSVQAIATEFFREAGEVAARHGTVVCVEANPVEYGGDFVTTVAEARQLVDRVRHPGFGLHLDIGGMILSGEDIPDVIRECGDQIRHFHVSEPFLAPVHSGDTDHETIAEALRDVGYDGWVSIEMRPDPEHSVTDHVGPSLERVVRAYGG